MSCEKKKRKVHKTLADFSNNKEETSPIEDDLSNAKPIPGATPSSNAMGEKELDNRINVLVEQKLAEFLERSGISGCKSMTKKGNKQTGYVRNGQWTEFLTYRKRQDEPFNETLKTILWFAKKYRESLEGGEARSPEF